MRRQQQQQQKQQKQQQHPAKEFGNHQYDLLASGSDTNKNSRRNSRNARLKVLVVLLTTLPLVYYITYLNQVLQYFTATDYKTYNEIRDLCNHTEYKYLNHCNKNTDVENAVGNYNKSSLIIFTKSDSVHNCTAIANKSTANTSTVTPTYDSNPYQFTNHFGSNIKYVQKYNGVWGMHLNCMKIFHSSYCTGIPNKTLDRSKNVDNTIYVLTFSCNGLYKANWFGTGNFMMAIYSLRRMAQQIGNIDISIMCNDAEETKDKLIVPWLMGSFPRTYWYDHKSDNDDNFMEQLVTRTGVSDVSCGTVLVPQLQPKMLPENQCRNYSSIYMYEDIIFELRRMAVALVGTLESNHPASAWAEYNLWQTNNTISHFKNSNMQLRTPQKHDLPILSNVEIDDVAFHVRCGDVVLIDNERFGFLKFHSYSKHLHNKKYLNQFQSIGIITQPFSGQGRFQDKRGNDRCYKVIHAFKNYLTDQNYTYHRYDIDGNINEEKVQITIRNNPDEYLTTAYARLVMA